MPTIFEMDPCPTLEQSCLHALQSVRSETLRNLKFCIFEQELPLSVAKNANDVPQETEPRAMPAAGAGTRLSQVRNPSKPTITSWSYFEGEAIEGRGIFSFDKS